MKKTLLSNDLKGSIISASTKLEEIVGCTLGSRGRNVIIRRKNLPPVIVNDGVTIAREFRLEDPTEDTIAQIIKQSSIKTNDVAGDGTTTATVLAHNLIVNAMTSIDNGYNAMDIKRGMFKAMEDIKAKIIKDSIPADTPEMRGNVARISAQDDEVGKLFSELEHDWVNGTITVEQKNGDGLSVRKAEGFEIDNGYISAGFINRGDKFMYDDSDVSVLVVADTIRSFNTIMPIITHLLENGKDKLVIFADDVVGDALTSLLYNKAQHKLSVVAVRVPGFGDSRRELMRDIAAVTTAAVIGEEGKTFKNLNMSDVGFAKQIRSDKDKTIIVTEGSELTPVRISAITERLKTPKLRFLISSFCSPFSQRPFSP